MNFTDSQLLVLLYWLVGFVNMLNFVVATGTYFVIDQLIAGELHHETIKQQSFSGNFFSFNLSFFSVCLFIYI